MNETIDINDWSVATDEQMAEREQEERNYEERVLGPRIRLGRWLNQGLGIRSAQRIKDMVDSIYPD